MVFANPPKFNVKEEYLVYDGVALVSSIGGTLGLSIGFSFYNLINDLMGWLRKGVKWICTEKVTEEKGLKVHNKVDSQKLNTSTYQTKKRMNYIENRFAAMQREMQDLTQIMIETRHSNSK